jgi:uncharacterized membrane protein
MGVRDVEIPPLLPLAPERTVSITTGRVTRVVIGLQVLVLAIVGVERLGLPLPIVRPVVTVVYLTLVPGYLLLRLAGITDESPIETVLYSVGVSLASLMIVGVIANFVLRGVGIERPMSELPIVLAVSAFVCLLTALYAIRVDEDELVTVDTYQLTSPTVLGLTLLPIVGIYGGLILTRFGNNYLLIALYTVLLAIPVFIVMGRLPDRLLPYVIWTAALALLLQNTLSGHFMAWGDSPKEARLALNVLRDGYWSPALAPNYGNKYTMLRIVMLHPIYALFTDLKFVWEFKLVHPLIFSLTPVALFHAYEQYVTKRTAFISTYLFMSLFSFFIVLSRNTRTATALLFLALFLLLIATTGGEPNRRKLLAIPFVAGVIVSHYGVSYMFMLMLGLVVPVRWILERLSSANRTNAPLTSPASVGLYGIMLFLWYVYFSPGSKTFAELIGTGSTFITRLTSESTALSSTSASTHYLTSNYTSMTLEFLRLYNVLVGGIMIVGLTLICLRLLGNRDVEFDAEYIAYASVALFVFGVTFLPIERFNTARTYPTTLLFYAPFFVLGLKQPIDAVGRYVGRIRAVDSHRIATVALVVFFALNVGLVSAAATNEYSTNALVEKDRVVDDGSPPAKSYFYKQYPTVYGITGTKWLTSTGAGGSPLYVNGWPGGTRGDVGHSPLIAPEGGQGDPAEFRYRRIRGEMVTDPKSEAGSQSASIEEGYLLFTAFGNPQMGDTISLPSSHFGFNYVETSDAEQHWRGKHLVYDNGGSRVYYSQSRSES